MSSVICSSFALAALAQPCHLGNPHGESGEIVLWAVRWYCRYAVSYCDLETMMTERGVAVDHSTIYRWVQHAAPKIEKRLRWQWRRPRSRSWRVEETYTKVHGKWASLYRALGNTIDFYLSATATPRPRSDSSARL